MDITFRTLGPWGPGKGSNLQPSEVDSNFWSIAQAILDLQENPSLPNGIASITVSGTQMTIYLNDGTVLGPYTLPVLTFTWRDEWEPGTSYAALDVFKVTNVGIFMVEISHISDVAFDPALTVGGQPALLQLFGSTDVRLVGLPDVLVDDSLQNRDILEYVDGYWMNLAPGDMLYQSSDAVDIRGGRITGMPSPVSASDVVNKAYVDALPAGMTAPPDTMMANIAGVTAPAIPNTLSAFLDAVLAVSVVGSLIYRSGTGWVALAPGTTGYYLRTAGPGADLLWDTGGTGVTAISAGPGISTGGAPITGAGTVSLAPVADNTILANASGTTTAPVPTTLSAFLDRVLTNARGALMTRTGAGWVALSPGTAGYYLKTQGAGTDLMWDAPSGAGTVTSVAAGAGLTTGGGPITGSGTISLAAIANLSLLANIGGASAAPSGTTVSQLLDAAMSGTQGAVLYRGNGGWVALSPGTSGQVLTTAGSAANPAWANVPASAPIANLLILGNISGSTAAATGVSLSAVIDAVFGSVRGMVLYRGAAGWAALAAGTAGQVLTTGGTASDPSWTTPTGGGGGASVSTGTTPPASPAAGDLWWDSSDGSGQLFVWFDDGTSAQWVVANSAIAAAPKYNIGFSFTGGVLANSQLLGMHRVSKAITIPANFGGHEGHVSQAGATAAATANTVISVDRALSASPNTFTQIGMITITAGGIAPTFATSGGAAISLAQGDVLRLVGPSSADTTLANFYATIVAQET